VTPTAVVTVGVFDGFHRGHASVVSRARQRADRANARLVLFTFDPHPETVLTKAGDRPRLALPGEKVELLREAGVDEYRVLRFSAAMAAKSPQAFLCDHVFPCYRLAVLVVGYDFAMGRDRTGTVPVLRALGRQFGFDVEEIEASRNGEVVVSSSGIRAALAAGRLNDVEGLLGRPYRLTGRVVSGDGRGRELGYPTANIAVDARKLQPERGVYVGRVSGGGLTNAPAVVNLGRRPTFGEGERTVEAHVLDFDGDLVGARLVFDFGPRLRSEVKFNDVNTLKAQIRADIERARDVLGAGEVT
jgi:riboflavin kinase/FMN adenylyltransferase